MIYPTSTSGQSRAQPCFWALTSFLKALFGASLQVTSLPSYKRYYLVTAQAARECYAVRDVGLHRIAFLSCTRYNYCNLVRA